ncbi:MAG: hypothetical protein IT323_16930 [Anaerolineae bacterium]|nr:hypothetical protein [Anaerolineae bacterium]
MAIGVRWENEEHTLIVWTFPDKWTWEDFYTAKNVSDEMLRSVSYVVSFIGDLTGTSVLPQGAIGTYGRSIRNAPVNIGVIVLVGASIFVRLMVETFNKIIPFGVPGASFLFANTLDEAKAVIALRHTAKV